MRKKTNIFSFDKTLSYIIELVIVAFGVFLGIYVSEWRNNVHNEHEALKALSFIEYELEQDLKNLEKSISYHELIKKNKSRLISSISKEEFSLPLLDNQVFFRTLIEGWQGIYLPQLELSAYESTKINGTFQDMDFDTVRKLPTYIV